MFKNNFKNPPKEFAPKVIEHGLESYDIPINDVLDRYEEMGYHGVVTNVPKPNGFTQNFDNLNKFSEIVNILSKKNIPFWIYDEDGYPSGRAGGLTLEGHPELASKGMFMYKRLSFSNCRAIYHLPDEADKIVWAAKYNFAQDNSCLVDINSMVPVPFNTDYLECDLKAYEALYIFSVKTTHEGTPGVHNVCSHKQNINILDEKAVRRFIDVAYEPIAKNVPNAYPLCENVFTDEPSLFVAYTRPSEVWNYATAPYVDGLFEEYEKEYGESILKYLPYIFEGTESAYPVRIKFYELIGKIIAKAYSGQLSKWCEDHGCGFSGHYLSEENIYGHVAFYGNLITVLCGASYPGVDILVCIPEMFQFVNTRIGQIAARKGGHNGMMVELCPFFEYDKFKKDPYNNMKCSTALCYLSGVRTANSYFKLPVDSPEIDKMNDFNTYTSRIGYVLDGLKNDTNVFVYYPIEDMQAKFRPRHSDSWAGAETSTRSSLDSLVDAIEFAGFDFYLADFNDIKDAESTLAKTGKAKISGFDVKTIIIPKIDVIRKSTLDSLKKLADSGVRIRFIDETPDFDGECDLELNCSMFNATDIYSVLEELYSDGGVFVSKNKNKIVRAKFKKGDKTIYMLVNTERTDAGILFNSETDGEIFNPDNGEITKLLSGELLTVPACRAIFVIV